MTPRDHVRERMDEIEKRQDESELTLEAIALLTNRVVDMTLEIREDIKRHDVELEEMKRENRQTRRIWIAIARKQELFDDDEFRDVFGDDDED